VAWGSIPKAIPYAKRYWRLGVVSIALMVFSTVITLLQPWPLAFVIMILVDKGHHGIPHWAWSMITGLVGSSPIHLILFAAIAGFAMTAMGQGLTVINEYVTTKLHQRLVLDLRSDLFQHAQQLSLSYHEREHTGYFIYRVSTLADSIGNALVAFPPLGQAALTLVLMFAISYTIDPVLGLLSLSIIPPIYFAVSYYSKNVLPAVRNAMGQELAALSVIYEAIAMMRVVVAFGREAFEFGRWRKKAERSVDLRVRVTVKQTAFSLVVETLLAGGTALVLYFGAAHVLEGKLELGRLTVIMAYVAAVYVPLQQISSTLGALNNDLYHLHVCQEMLAETPEIQDAPYAIELNSVHGEVAYEDVTFAYEGRDTTLDGVRFHIQPGQRVGILGPTGAGKTTLFSLLMRFHDPQEGQICIDGTDIRRITQQSLRRHISIVLQDPLLFSGSIADNIRYGKLDASMREIVEAAKAANAHEFIERLPHKYQTELGERGAQLSGGERQRISIARAFLKNAPILVLDEPTSSIDSRTEAVILDALDRLMESRTTFIISHRLSTMRSADMILVLDQGRLVEQGSPSELMARGRLYREMYEAQLLPDTRWTGSPSAEQLERAPHIATLAARLASENEYARREALEALRQMDHSEVSAWARDAIVSGSYQEACTGAAVAQALGLADLGVDLLDRAAAMSPGARGPLLRAFASFSFDPDALEAFVRSVDGSRRAEAVKLLADVLGPEALPGLLRLVDGNEPGLEAAARQALGDVRVFSRRQPDASSRLEPARDEVDAERALRRLASASSEDAARALRRLLEAQPREAASLVLRAAARKDGPSDDLAQTYVPVLWDALRAGTPAERTPLLSDLDPVERRGLASLAQLHAHAAESVDRILTMDLAPRAATPEAIDVLLEGLGDPDQEVRVAATRSLGLLRRPRAILPLAERLADTSPEVRAEAVWGLALTDDARVLAPLVGALDDPDPHVRHQATRGLRRWDTPELKRLLAEREAGGTPSQSAAGFEAPRRRGGLRGVGVAVPNESAPRVRRRGG